MDDKGQRILTTAVSVNREPSGRGGCDAVGGISQAALRLEEEN